LDDWETGTSSSPSTEFHSTVRRVIPEQVCKGAGGSRAVICEDCQRLVDGLARRNGDLEPTSYGECGCATRSGTQESVGITEGNVGVVGEGGGGAGREGPRLKAKRSADIRVRFGCERGSKADKDVGAPEDMGFVFMGVNSWWKGVVELVA